ncbi:MAG: FAD-dependent oxidoreductase [Desulfobacula sp.]|jgi:sarcosine oxidase, subunit alpha|uniref:FAD-dependent oxidoreductase n=2 Tax=Desulfobacula sp. TaxID=2593537 RepID=UPI001D4C194E|nr:FAD-dependent oxidoreductase [Desulfobacula sp.]MBT4508980.1 FAD-dependent oxidoreductase [Desulfobacula sp.]MBT5546330.1 FAD-dependent oxidoreductase [Desulfobacula sp.]MBT5973332.1 FAD-dependent oxidoreductase [Desulfobacula sp.]MBT6751540.1 FAD-dependent oxidoreductase [Desulfobacula sp.]
MTKNRIKSHPILDIPKKEPAFFYWDKLKLEAIKDEMISSALFANNIKIFGHHHKDGSAQGIFCANGQCAKCTVIANGIPVKACMTPVRENMIVESVKGLPRLPDVDKNPQISNIEHLEIDVLIIGGGPAGLSASLQLEQEKINTILVDDKDELGGKLVLQTHKFFGSQKDSYAGMRGMDIGGMLAQKVEAGSHIKVWKNSTALYVFNDKKVGILKHGVYKIVTPKVILNAAGAREKFLRFKGNSLSGVYGAGAFQTLVNRDLVKPTEKLFIIGGGNVGIIAGYHALQAGIKVVGLAEGLPKCGGYKVHEDKLKRLGVPIYTSHSIVSANGEESVSSVTIAGIDKNFKVIEGTHKTFECDTILIAVGLESVSEFTQEAESAGIKVFAAGDASQIAEASSAMFNGKIAGVKVVQYFKPDAKQIPESWYEKADILKSHPGPVQEILALMDEDGIFPVIHCKQEIPCNPCSTVCPEDLIQMQGDPIKGLPKFDGKCKGCMKCLAICPGLAITLVDYRKDPENPVVFLPYEISNFKVSKNDEITLVDVNGKSLGTYNVIGARATKDSDRTQIVRVKVPKKIAKKVVAFTIQEKEITKELIQKIPHDHIRDDEVVCLCERVTADQIRDLVRKGITDMNQIKAISRAGMGPCGYKTCENLMNQIFWAQKTARKNIVKNVRRPLFIEVPLGKFANGGQ